MLKLHPGQLFQGRYHIEQELGAGGMGIVYRAMQIDASRQVALKVLRPERIGQEAEFKRFLREFQLLSRVAHPNVVVFYTHGVSGEGIPYAVCEYLNGRSLLAVLNQETSLDWRRAAKISRQIASGLQEAHSLGIVHRDLKPGNIMLCDKPEPDWVKIIDFGLARVEDYSTLEKLTLSGSLIGSVHYMSPEQCQAQPADRRSDIYALGCILYEMLAGEKLFTQTNPTTVLYLHCTADLSERVELLSGRVPPKLQSLLLQMLARSPQDRPESMEEIANSLTMILQDPGTSAQMSGAELIRPGKRLLLLSVALTLLFLSALLYVAFVKQPFGGTKLSKNNVAAPERRVHARRNFQLLLEEAERIFPGDENRNARKKIYQNWIDKYGHDSRLKPSERAVAYGELLNIQDADENKAILEQCSSLLNQMSFTDPRERTLNGKFLTALAFFYLRQGDRNKAVKCERRLLTAYQNIELQKKDQSVGLCTCALASLGEFSPALELEKKFIAECDAKDAESYMRAGGLCVLLQKPHEALDYYKAELRLLESKGIGDSSTVTDLQDAGIFGSPPHFTLPGNRRMLKEPLYSKLAGIAKRVLPLDKKMAEQIVRKAVAAAMAESDQVKLSSWQELEALAARLDLKERHLCAAKIIPLFKSKVAESTDAGSKYELASELSFRLYSSGQEEQALKFFKAQSSTYASSPHFQEFILIRHFIDMAKVSLYGESKTSSESLMQKALKLLSKYPEEKVPAELDAAMGVFLTCKKDPAAEKTFEQVMNKCLRPGKNTNDLGLSFDYMILASRFDQCRRLLKCREGWQDSNRLVSLAERELIDGRKEAARKDFEEAYMQYFNTRKDLGFPDDYVRCKAGIIAANQ